MTLAEALEALRAGRPVLLYDADGREEETDLFVAAEHATPEAVRLLRRDAGGLVFLAVAPQFGRRFGLPFLQDMYAEDAARHPVLADLVPNDIRYDSRSSFSLTLNHRKTFTGITDRDRSLTITEFARTCREAMALAEPEAQRLLGSRFRAPGHVHLCVGADGLLARRQGHTELAVALAELAGADARDARGADDPVGSSSLTPVVAGAEMLGDDGRALPRAAAEAWAAAHDGVRLDGAEVQRAWAKLNDARAVATAR